MNRGGCIGGPWCGVYVSKESRSFGDYTFHAINKVRLMTFGFWRHKSLPLDEAALVARRLGYA